MQLTHRSFSPRTTALFCTVLFSTVAARPSAFAMADPAIDPMSLSALEQRATLAAPRDQAILFTDLADRLTLVAARQIQAGDLEQAAVTLQRVEQCTDRIQTEVNAKSRDLKKAELRLHDTERRLRDMVRVAAQELRPRVQATLARLNETQRALLNLLFEK